MSVIVVIKDEAMPAAFIARAEAEGMEVKTFESLDRLFEIMNREVEDLPLDRYPEISSVEPGDKVLRATFVQDLDFSAGWNDDNWALARHTRRDPPWPIYGARLPFSSDVDLDRDGTGVDIYVIDTGIEVAHPEFDGRATMIYEFTSTGGVGDDHGHGTACSACAAGSNIGFARGALLWGAKVLANDNTGSIANIVAGINAAVTHYNGRSATNRPAVMSISIIGDSSGYNSAIAAATAAGIVVVAAAGNDASNLDGSYGGFPAESPGALAVGAIQPGDAPASFTNYGTRVDLLAAGYLVWTAGLQSLVPGGYRSWNGTSFACPTVAGCIACVLQDYQRLTNHEQTQIVKNYMKDQATWDRYLPDPRFEPMTPAILYLEPGAVYPAVPGLTPLA